MKLSSKVLATFVVTVLSISPTTSSHDNHQAESDSDVG